MRENGFLRETVARMNHQDLASPNRVRLLSALTVFQVLASPALDDRHALELVATVGRISGLMPAEGRAQGNLVTNQTPIAFDKAI